MPVALGLSLLACGTEDPGSTGVASIPGDDAGVVTPPPPDAGPEREPQTGPDSDAADAWPAMCSYDDGTAVIYDHTRGIVDEYAFDLATSCELGGFIIPLVEADPVGLGEVAAFNTALTDWYRARILGCDAATSAPRNAFLLVPLSQADGMSKGDFQDTIKLFGDVLDRHEGMADGISLEARNEVKKRLHSFEKLVVKQDTLEHTHRSDAPQCNR
jgi:hypothetical protein